MKRTDVIIIGAGVSGLSCALKLQQCGIDFTLLEGSERLGGVVRSERNKGFLCEYGPNTLRVSSPEVEDLLKYTGALEVALETSAVAKKRFVLQDARLRPLPASFWQFLTTDVISRDAKLRLLQEFSIPKGDDPEESVSSFVKRRLGDEILTEMVGPFISGIYAGDPERLIVRQCFPQLYDLEQKNGSIFKGLLASVFRKNKSKKVKTRMLSWSGGLEELISILSRPILKHITSSAEVETIFEKRGDYEIMTNQGVYHAKHVVVATTSTSAANILKSLSPHAITLDAMPYAPVVVVHLGYPREAVGHALDGFGVLVSRARKLRILGALFSSSLFPGRAPDGQVLLTCFMGGALDSAALDLRDDDLQAMIHTELEAPLGLKSEPVFRNVLRWSKAIPQYEAGYDTVVQTRDSLQQEYAGLYLIGSYLQGVSLQDCMLNGIRVAETINSKIHRRDKK